MTPAEQLQRLGCDVTILGVQAGQGDVAGEPGLALALDGPSCRDAELCRMRA